MMNNEKLQLLRELVRSGNTAGIAELFRREIELDRNNLQTYQVFTDVYLKYFDRKSALEAITLMGKLPRQAINYDQLRKIHDYYKSTGCFDIAMLTAKVMRMAAGNDPQRLVQAGTELGSLRLHDEALKCFEKLVKKKPDDPVANFLMGTAQNSCNKPAGAETSFKRCISLNSAFYPAYLSLSQLKKQRDSSNHLDSLKKRLKESNGDPAASRFLNFALAKELDDLGRSDESFACLSAANDVVRLAQPYDHSIEQDTFEKVVACYTKLKARGVTGNDSSAPVFIVGMPRSGTTLVERVLAASDSVYAGGELHDFIGQFVYQYGLLPERQNLPAIFGKAHQFDYRKIGKGYVDSVLSRSSGRPVFTDKMPFNFRYLGFIRAALPNCKIIHIQRSSQATLLSNYQQNYRAGINLWSYDKAAARKYFELYQDYMNYWKAEIPNGFLNIQYEELVQDFEAVSRKLYEYCGIEWTDECLRFNEINVHSGTQSSAQVRQPIYTTSLNKWKDYSAHLSEWSDLGS